MTANHKEIADKYTGKDCYLYTLDGTEQAKIQHAGEHAVIASEESRLSIFVSWLTVARKMESDKLFYAC